jgi:hypothetical protein
MVYMFYDLSEVGKTLLHLKKYMKAAAKSYCGRRKP